MLWDDLELLRVIDEIEQAQGTGVLNGLWLMQDSRWNGHIDRVRDLARFAHELVLARDAGYVTFEERLGHGQHRTDPASDPNLWLQHIQNIRLTLAGRDRTRGRIVVRQLPDPSEDDDRPIAAITLEDIARSIGGIYNASQLPKFLRDSGIPEDFLPQTGQRDKWEYVLDVFERLHDGGFAARRTLRDFIGHWLDDRLLSSPRPDERRRIIHQLQRQGWYIRDGRLVVGEPQIEDVEVSSAIGRDAQIAMLHARVRQAAERYLVSGHVEVAVFEAFKAVLNRVKAMTGLDADGKDLMAKAFSGNNPLIELADLSTMTGRDIQEGFRFMFMGAVCGIRNPNAHELFQSLDEDEAFEMLALASMLMRRLDDAKFRHSGQ